MAWKKGESGNPNGRPKKGFGLTDILSRAGAKSVQIAGRGMSRKRLVAQLVWQATTEGYVEFPDGRREEIDINTWLAFVKWLYDRVDGPPKQAMDVTSGDEPLSGGGGVVIILPSNGREIEDSPSTGAADDIS